MHSWRNLVHLLVDRLRTALDTVMCPICRMSFDFSHLTRHCLFFTVLSEDQ